MCVHVRVCVSMLLCTHICIMAVGLRILPAEDGSGSYPLSSERVLSCLYLVAFAAVKTVMQSSRFSSRDIKGPVLDIVGGNRREI